MVADQKECDAMSAVIRNAIKHQHRVQIDYPPGARIVEPHVLGFSKDGHLLLRGFQTDGASAGGEPTNWKLFRLGRVRAVVDTGQTFSGTRPGYNRDDPAMKGGIVARL